MVQERRKNRSVISEKDVDLSKPFDVTKFGSDSDPCFGKLHDLMAKECRVCGDSEFCAIVKSQKLRTNNIELEKEQRFKDIEEANLEVAEKEKKAKELIAKHISNNIRTFRIVNSVSKELNLDKDRVRELIKTFR